MLVYRRQQWIDCLLLNGTSHRPGPPLQADMFGQSQLVHSLFNSSQEVGDSLTVASALLPLHVIFSHKAKALVDFDVGWKNPCFLLGFAQGGLQQ